MKVGDSVIVQPAHDDTFTDEFVGVVAGFRLGFVTVSDGDDNKFDVRPEQVNPDFDEVEVTGGVMMWESDDGTIRYRDDHGNTEGLWPSDDPEYAVIKAQYFPDHKVMEVADTD